MGKYKDLSGCKFGKLTVLSNAGKNKQGTYRWLCICECGNETMVRGSHLSSNKITSCGCYRNNKASERLITHGKTNSRLYKIWAGIKKRVENQKSKNYNIYGGRGVSICNEWKNDFQAFHDWAISNGYYDDLTIDRINVNGNYSPENCRWASMKTQQRNRRNNHIIEYDGEAKTISEWAEIHGLKYATLLRRIKTGISVEISLKMPLCRKRQ